MAERVQTPPGVLHVVWSLGVAGAEKLAFDMALSLPSSGFRPLVCSVEHDGPLRRPLEEAGIPVFVKKPRSGLDWKVVKWLRDLVVSEGISVVHAHQYNPFFYCTLALAGLPGVRLVYTEHGRVYPEVRNWKRMLVNPLLARRIDHLVSISEGTRDAMVAYDRLPAQRIRVIHNGVQHERYGKGFDVRRKRRELGIADGCRVIGTAARLEPVKNLPMMIRAFAAVRERCPETVLLIAGEGGEEAGLRALASELGVAEQVSFLGLRSDLPEILPLMEVYLLSSHTEGISITLLEAMASGVPAVVTRVGGNPEVVVEGGTGFLVAPGAHREMADRVVALLSDAGLTAAMQLESRQRVAASFSFTGMFSRYCELYRSPTRAGGGC